MLQYPPTKSPAVNTDYSDSTATPAIDATTVQSAIDSIKLNYAKKLKVVRALITANVNLASTSVSQDGLTLVAGDQVLVAGQTTTSQNGVFTVGTVSGGLAPLTRPTSIDGTDELYTGYKVRISAGSNYINTEWELVTTGTITPGTTGLLWRYAGGDAPVNHTVYVASTGSDSAFGGINTPLATIAYAITLLGLTKWQFLGVVQLDNSTYSISPSSSSTNLVQFTIPSGFSESAYPLLIRGSDTTTQVVAGTQTVASSTAGTSTAFATITTTAILAADNALVGAFLCYPSTTTTTSLRCRQFVITRNYSSGGNGVIEIASLTAPSAGDTFTIETPSSIINGNMNVYGAGLSFLKVTLQNSTAAMGMNFYNDSLTFNGSRVIGNRNGDILRIQSLSHIAGSALTFATASSAPQLQWDPNCATVQPTLTSLTGSSFVGLSSTYLNIYVYQPEFPIATGGSASRMTACLFYNTQIFGGSFRTSTCGFGGIAGLNFEAGISHLLNTFFYAVTPTTQALGGRYKTALFNIRSGATAALRSVNISNTVSTSAHLIAVDTGGILTHSALSGTNSSVTGYPLILDGGCFESGGSAPTLTTATPGSDVAIVNGSTDVISWAEANNRSPLQTYGRLSGGVINAGTYTVAALPTGQMTGTMAWASDARTGAEGAAAGTGALVTYKSSGPSGAGWYLAGTGSLVTS